MSARAGSWCTGTEVLSGRVSDRNGPWLAERLLEARRRARAHRDRGRPRRGHGGGAALHGPAGGRPGDHQRRPRPAATADDLTAEVVGRVQGRRDGARRGARRAHRADRRAARQTLAQHRPEAIRAANRKQATHPQGRHRAEPVGTAPGLRGRARRRRGRTCPHDRGAAGPAAGAAADVGPGAGGDALRAVLDGATSYRQGTLRLFGIPESEIAETLRVAERDGVELASLELHHVPRETRRGRGGHALRAARRGGLRGLRGARPRPSRRRALLRGREHVDELVAGLLGGTGSHPARTIATASRAPAGCSRRA